MTVSATPRKAGPYPGTGTTGPFDFYFKVFSASDVVVVRTDAYGAETELTTGDYSVSLNPDQDASPGGSITLTAALSVGYLVTLASSVSATQSLALTNLGGFFAELVNAALDRLTMVDQQILEQLGRTLKWPISSQTGSLPTPEAGKFLGWNSAGDGITNLAGTGVGDAENVAASDGGTGSLWTTVQGFINKILSSAGASIIGFIQAGVGAVAQSVQSKLRKTIHPEDYGAAGDGVVDDYLAIQRTLDQNQTGTIEFTGQYKSSAEIVLTNSSGKNFQGRIIGKNGASITFTNTNLTTSVDSATARGFSAYAKINGAGGDTSGFVGGTIEGLRIVAPVNGIGIYLANSQSVSIKKNTIIGGRYSLVTECCINTEIHKNTFHEFINAGIGFLMTGDTARVWYASGTPSSSYWNDSPQITGNGFATDVANGLLCMILDHGSTSERVRTVQGNFFYSGTNAQCQYGIISRNADYTIDASNWFENINYPVRFLSTNAAEGGSGTALTGVTAAQPSGTYTVGSFVDGYGDAATISGNYTVRAVTDYDVGGIQGSVFVRQNTSSGSTGAFLKSTQAGTNFVVDGGNTLIGSTGVYKNLTYGQYVHLYKGDDTGTIDALTGNTGEYIDSAVAAGSALALTTATMKNITSITLTPGDWELGGNVAIGFTGATATVMGGGIHTANNFYSIDRYGAQYQLNGAAVGGLSFGLTVPTQRRKVAVTTTFYLNTQANFSVGTAAAYGSMWARRVR